MVSAGVVTGVATGAAIITGEYGGQSRTARVDVGVSWRPAGELLANRSAAEAVALRDGRVLVMGRGTVATEVFDPATGRSVAAAPWNDVRVDFTATLLADGRVLVTGGDDFNATQNLASAILFDPASLTWSNAASMAFTRVFHTATLLQDGRVLVVGGTGAAGTKAEIYDPAGNTWSTAASLAKPRSFHAATLLQDGRVMVSGGFDGGDGVSFSSSLVPTARVELFDPLAGTSAAAASMIGVRYSHTATLLADGRLLVAGGSPYADSPRQYLGTAELFVPRRRCVDPHRQHDRAALQPPCGAADWRPRHGGEWLDLSLSQPGAPGNLRCREGHLERQAHAAAAHRFPHRRPAGWNCAGVRRRRGWTTHRVGRVLSLAGNAMR